MKKTLLFLFLLIGIIVVNAQNKDWSVDLNYPISVGEDFGSSNQGVIGLGLKYRFHSIGRVRIGASVDATWFATTFINDTDPIQELKFRDFFLQPRVFAELPLSQNDKWRLLGGLGWTWYRSTGETFFDQEGQVQGQEWNNGFNMNVGLSYDVASRWFILAQYDLIFSSGDSTSKNLGLIKLGAGFRF